MSQLVKDEEDGSSGRKDVESTNLLTGVHQDSFAFAFAACFEVFHVFDHFMCNCLLSSSCHRCGRHPTLAQLRHLSIAAQKHRCVMCLLKLEGVGDL